MGTSDESNTTALTSLRLKLVKFYKINYSCFHFIPQFYLKPATVNEKCIWKESFVTKNYYVQKIWLVLQFKKKNHIPKKIIALTKPGGYVFEFDVYEEFQFVYSVVLRLVLEFVGFPPQCFLPAAYRRQLPETYQRQSAVGSTFDTIVVVFFFGDG